MERIGEDMIGGPLPGGIDQVALVYCQPGSTDSKYSHSASIVAPVGCDMVAGRWWMEESVVENHMGMVPRLI